MTVKKVNHDTVSGAKGPDKKRRKGFSVGPANLPDGTYRRKTQKIKHDLIQKAKVKKAYAKVKAQEESAQNTSTKSSGDTLVDAAPASLELHPDRQAMLDAAGTQCSTRKDSQHEHNGDFDRSSRPSKPKQSRYKKEMELAAEHRAKLEAKRKARESREKDRRAMAKAKRPGKDGKAKLGRQGTILLNRIRRMTEEGKI
ncbi:uncharacterized protein Z518_03661 [Rhinocladiella mackenziei CBS 650.93]|uniref:Rhinocladiella mackenziei CBS 650.93 unplaced genomic scaffold supercont1.3, whole genome shotgun sequence n=1 Tax=Rhinocladiella mackenziei CBS 650.93 TaxID=1442369 RepID=A0A0D2IIV8_9EURO|nr:uncharacterized protein Z518_03661 [Rhinocladiella mackenziei CBS 650.93]KIX05689.1 hypothetical protein Z518_03661 [Rhinocladiella mackenziei CBS 650.93]